MLRPLWYRVFKTEWILAIFLLFLLSIPRFIIVLQANVSRNYTLVPIIFVSMMLMPFIFLSKSGRRQIGLKKPKSWAWLMYSLLIGVGVCLTGYLVTWVIFGNTIGNWAVYISNSYQVPEVLSDSDRLIYFVIYSVVGMSFSPFGEELFYRGVLHELFATKVSDRRARTLDSLAFALIHLAHFGIVYTVDGWRLLIGPSVLWVTFLFGVCWIFSVCRVKAESVFGAVLCHAGFNLGMMYIIFYIVF